MPYSQIYVLGLQLAQLTYYLPIYYFENCDSIGSVEEFTLIDGGVATDNPVINTNSIL